MMYTDENNIPTLRYCDVGGGQIRGGLTQAVTGMYVNSATSRGFTIEWMTEWTLAVLLTLELQLRRQASV